MIEKRVIDDYSWFYAKYGGSWYRFVYIMKNATDEQLISFLVERVLSGWDSSLSEWEVGRLKLDEE